MKIGSLFSGYEGLGVAVQNVIGGDLAWVSDIDPGACKILAHHYPDVPNLGDITRVDWAAVEPVDVITGGSPCQDLSHAGKRGGMTTGTRSNLWVEMREAIAQIRPGLVVWENVRGAYSAAADSAMEPCAGCVGERPGVVLRALGRVLGDLSELGYDTAWHGLRAADVGAPHGRFRVFVAAWPADTDRAGLEIGCGIRRDAEQERATIGRSDPHAVTLLPTPTAAPYGNNQSQGAGAAVRPSLDSLAPMLLATPTVAAATGGAPQDSKGKRDLRLDIARIDWGVFEPAIRQWEALTRPAPAPTETGPRGGQRLSPRFVEFLMGLPDGWVTDPVIGLTRNEQLKALGNGVVPQQAEAALRWLLNIGAVAA